MMGDEKPNCYISQVNPVKTKYKHARRYLGWKDLKKKEFKNGDMICGNVGVLSPYGIFSEL